MLHVKSMPLLAEGLLSRSVAYNERKISNTSLETYRNGLRLNKTDLLFKWVSEEWVSNTEWFALEATFGDHAIGRDVCP